MNGRFSSASKRSNDTRSREASDSTEVIRLTMNGRFSTRSNDTRSRDWGVLGLEPLHFLVTQSPRFSDMNGRFLSASTRSNDTRSRDWAVSGLKCLSHLMHHRKIERHKIKEIKCFWMPGFRPDIKPRVLFSNSHLVLCSCHSCDEHREKQIKCVSQLFAEPA